MKTRKSIKKRFRIKKQGKVLRRAIGQDHFRAKKSGNKKRQLRKWVRVDDTTARIIKKSIK